MYPPGIFNSICSSDPSIPARFRAHKDILNALKEHKDIYNDSEWNLWKIVLLVAFDFQKNCGHKHSDDRKDHKHSDDRKEASACYPCVESVFKALVLPSISNDMITGLVVSISKGEQSKAEEIQYPFYSNQIYTILNDIRNLMQSVSGSTPWQQQVMWLILQVVIKVHPWGERIENAL